MKTLYVRSVPDEVYRALQKRSKERKSSISKEACRLLEEAIRADRPGLRELLAEIEEDRPAARGRAIPAARLIREDRER